MLKLLGMDEVLEFGVGLLFDRSVGVEVPSDSDGGLAVLSALRTLLATLLAAACRLGISRFGYIMVSNWI